MSGWRRPLQTLIHGIPYPHQKPEPKPEVIEGEI